PVPVRKWLRRQGGRRLMRSTIVDASTASQRVGYLSPSQFSREYSRFFGSAPSKDIARLRQDTRAWVLSNLQCRARGYQCVPMGKQPFLHLVRKHRFRQVDCVQMTD